MAGKMARDIKTFEARVKTDADKVMESFLFGLYGEIIRRTPVAALNGGRARGSWEMGTGLATNRSVDGPKNKSGAVRPPSGLAGMARKSDRVPVYISSAIPYIVPLEHGHSTQAPKHFMVKGSIIHTVAQFRKGK
jgi:hypothetical protein